MYVIVRETIGSDKDRIRHQSVSAVRHTVPANHTRKSSQGSSLQKAHVSQSQQ
ncbi:unnamed protein product [Periconia digitata]|uniref:Uncharacterized protein n=1 Tax=Periconia digitata TaxID=1303443 RepID=A0A9W4UEH5_9PLEO|nr:unnamed protein product [Periconia digitata]